MGSQVMISCAASAFRAARNFRAAGVPWLMMGAALLAFSLPGNAASSGNAALLQVSAAGETLLGTLDPAVQGVAVFRGIPYAAPPVGAMRWAPPQPAKSRVGMQAATAYAAGCYQDSYNTDWYRRVGAAFGVPADKFSDPAFSEDCLYLNVWTTSLPAVPNTQHGMLPVMVWLHGGSNKGGWSFEANYHSARLAAAGPVVVVTIGYRLGVFGFFSHPELAAAGISPNFGLQDQMAALQWVKQNVAAFGGNADNVTVFGESAGGKDIGYLLASPQALGLFKRAIVQSGGFEMTDRATVETMAVAGTKVAQRLQQTVPTNPPASSQLAFLRSQPASAVFAAAKEVLPGHDYTPVVDGSSVTQTPARAMRGSVPYDLLLGFNGAENHMYDRGDVAAFEAYIRDWPKPVADALLARAAREKEARHGRDVVNTFIDNACSGYTIAGAVNRGGKQAWLYHFTRVREGKGGKTLLAYHGSEIPYVFDTHDAWLPTTAADRNLTKTMMRYWLNFATNGDPNGPGVMTWPAFVGPNPQMQQLDVVVGTKHAPEHELCVALRDQLYPG
jgi:para-nitrobenzyl esterase